MLQIRRSHERGHADHGWLDTYHTFSFADYYDPRWTGFRTLRVVNEDRVAPGTGFGLHPHRDMEILTCVLSGTLEHKDSLGHGAQLRPGEWQHMTAGTGIRHSEYNPSATEPVHLYQIWLLPERQGLTPGYGQKEFAAEGRRGRWQLVASRDGRDGALQIHQDADVSVLTLEAGGEVAYELQPQRHAWLQVLRGDLRLNGQPLATGDGAALTDERTLTVASAGDAEVLLFDLA